MYNMIKSELYKLKRDKNIWFISLIIIIAAILTVITNTTSTGKVIYSSEFKAMTALVACALYAGISIGADFTRRTLQRSIIAGHSRLSILCSRLISYFLVCTLFTLISSVVFGGLYSLCYGWGEPFHLTEFLYVIKSTMLSIVFNLCTSSIMFFIAFLIKDIGMSTAATICVMIFLMVFTQNIDGYVADYLGGGTYEIPIQVIYQTIIISILKLIGSLLLSYRVFETSELK